MNGTYSVVHSYVLEALALQWSGSSIGFDMFCHIRFRIGNMVRIFDGASFSKANVNTGNGSEYLNSYISVSGIDGSLMLFSLIGINKAFNHCRCACNHELNSSKGPFIYYVSTFFLSPTSFSRIFQAFVPSLCFKFSNFNIKFLSKCNVEKTLLFYWKNQVFMKN